MKKLTILMGLLTLFTSCSGLKRIEKQPLLTTTPTVVELASTKGKDSVVDLDYKLNVPEKYITKRDQMVYQPQFISGTREENLTPVIISGKKYAKKEARMVKRGEELPMADGVRVIGDKEPLEIDYSTKVPTEEWMEDSELVGWSIFNSRHGKKTIINRQTLARGVTMAKEEPKKVQKPKKVEKKVVKEEEKSEKIYFEMNQSDYDMNLGSNGQNLIAMKNLLSKIENDNSLKLTKIEIVGSASPDGSSKINNYLAEQRAKTVENMVIKECNVAENMVKTSSVGANWAGFIAMVQESAISNKEKIISIAEGNGSDMTKTMRLRALPQYSALKREIFPKLRNVCCEVFYNKTTFEMVDGH